MMRVYHLGNGFGDSLDASSPSEMLEFLNATDLSDREHGAVWLSDGIENSLEYSGVGLLVFDRSGSQPRHMVGVSKEQVVRLWALLGNARITEVEQEPWQPGSRPPMLPEEAARLQREIAEWQRDQDRKFYDVLGPEHATERCRHAECSRGHIRQSVFCRIHHFETVWGRPCPFTDWQSESAGT